jgi:hypothetical protein
VVQICQQHGPAAAPPAETPPAIDDAQVLQALAPLQQQLHQLQQSVQALINRTSLQLQDARSLNSAALLPRHKLVPVPNRDSGAMPPANIRFTRTRAVEVPNASAAALHVG